jgi:hypothetical protein
MKTKPIPAYYASVLIILTASLITHAGNVIVKNVQINASGNFYAGGNMLYVEQSTGNVGIGTTSPNAKLDIDAGTSLEA